VVTVLGYSGRSASTSSDRTVARLCASEEQVCVCGTHGVVGGGFPRTRILTYCVFRKSCAEMVV